jgi:hypothetical protein
VRTELELCLGPFSDEDRAEMVRALKEVGEGNGACAEGALKGRYVTNELGTFAVRGLL